MSTDMVKEIHPCLGCGKTTTARCQICDSCLHLRRHKYVELNAVAGSTPMEHLYDEFSHDYSEDSLGPHGIDDRFGWEFIEKQFEKYD
jgi:hypothetical protein